MAETNPDGPLGQDSFRFVAVDDVDFTATHTIGGQWGQHKNTVDYFIKQYLKKNMTYNNGEFEMRL